MSVPLCLFSRVCVRQQRQRQTRRQRQYREREEKRERTNEKREASEIESEMRLTKTRFYKVQFDFVFLP